MGPPGDLSGPRARNVRPGLPSGLALGAVLGASWAILEAAGAVLGPSVAVFGPSWKPIGPCWEELGGVLGRLGAPVSRKGENVKIIEILMGNHQLLPPGGALGRSLEGLLGRLKGSSGGLEAILGVLDRSFGDEELSWIVLGASWGPLGALRGAWKAAPRRKTISESQLPGGGRAAGGRRAGYFSPGDPQGPPRARELELLLTSHRRS